MKYTEALAAFKERMAKVIHRRDVFYVPNSYLLFYQGAHAMAKVYGIYGVYRTYGKPHRSHTPSRSDRPRPSHALLDKQ